MTRWHGLVALVGDAVHHGTATVERVHQSVARTALDVVAYVPALAPGARCAAAWQEKLIAATYGTIRGVNAAVGAIAGACLEAAESRKDVARPGRER